MNYGEIFLKFNGIFGIFFDVGPGLLLFYGLRTNVFKDLNAVTNTLHIILNLTKGFFSHLTQSFRGPKI